MKGEWEGAKDNMMINRHGPGLDRVFIGRSSEHRWLKGRAQARVWVLVSLCQAWVLEGWRRQGP